MGWFRRRRDEPKKTEETKANTNNKGSGRPCKYCEALSGGQERAKKMNYCEKDVEVVCLLKPSDEPS